VASKPGNASPPIQTMPGAGTETPAADVKKAGPVSDKATSTIVAASDQSTAKPTPENTSQTAGMMSDKERQAPTKGVEHVGDTPGKSASVISNAGKLTRASTPGNSASPDNVKPAGTQPAPAESDTVADAAKVTGTDTGPTNVGNESPATATPEDSATFGATAAADPAKLTPVTSVEEVNASMSQQETPGLETAPAVDGDDKSGPADTTIQYSLKSPELYLNRELTWLSFDERVLHEAEDSRNPLLERVKFLAISDNNLDEFVMKRISWVKQQLATGIQQATVDGRMPAQQITDCNEAIRSLRSKQEEVYSELLIELAAHDIRILQYQDLTDQQQEQIRDDFIQKIFPIVTPLAMDPGHPFPFISNLTINLLLTMRFPGETELQTARVKVPAIKDLTSRFLPVIDDNAHVFVTLDEVITNNLDLIFPGMEIVSCELFRVTRNINVVPLEDTATDLVEIMQSELRARRFAPIVRLEVASGMDDAHRGMLAAELDLDPEMDVFELHGMMGMSDLFEIAALDLPELHQPPHQPVDHPVLATDTRNIFHVIRDNGPLLLQHPYQSFTASVERLLRTASEDPKVLAIKMTLYRTSAKAEIIDLLVNAARNGKQVAVLVELRARFDEAANIDRGRSLEEAGVHVTYGVEGLKTHSKTILVVRQDYDRLRLYCHIGTGNYNPETAGLYSDMGLLTCDEDIGHDLTQLFNYLTGYSPPPSYRKILAAPYSMKKPLIRKIEREAALHSDESPGHIQLKTNALEDADVTRALYKAARTGVKIDLIVRDSCRLIPGLPDLSETVRVISIVGRFLEHSRIYYFHNGGDEEYYLGSADLMQRNLEERVEVLVPVEDPELQQDIKLALTAQLSDLRNAWELMSDGTYLQRQPNDEKAERGCQEDLIRAAVRRLDAAADMRKGQQSMSKEKKVRRKLLDRFEKRLEKF
jgi:polyphosphate kinase